MRPALRSTPCPCRGTDEMCPCQNDPALRGPTFLGSRIAQLRAEVAYLDSTDGHQNRADAERRAEKTELLAEMIWRRDNPENTGRFRIAVRGKPVPFTEAGGRECFNTRAEADAYLAQHLPNGHRDVGVIDTAPDRDAALASVHLHMHAEPRPAAPNEASIRAGIAKVLNSAGMVTPVGREPLRAEEGLTTVLRSRIHLPNNAAVVAVENIVNAFDGLLWLAQDIGGGEFECGPAHLERQVDEVANAIGVALQLAGASVGRALPDPTLTALHAALVERMAANAAAGLVGPAPEAVVVRLDDRRVHPLLGGGAAR